MSIDEYVKEGQRVVAEAAESGRSASQILGALCAGIGLIARGAKDAAQVVGDAQGAIENLAGVRSDATMASLMPCPECWDNILSEARERGATGTGMSYCEHRGLAVEVAAESGQVTAWHLKPATADDLAEFKRQKTRAHFREHGLTGH